MSSEKKKRQSGCAITYGLDTFGDRWSLLIIRDIMLKNKRTYSEFLAGGEKISTNILIDRLKHLEAEGIIIKNRDPENRRCFVYSLSEKGLDLAPIIIEIAIWSGAHDQRPFARRETLKEITADRTGFENRVRSAVPKT